MLGGGNRRVAAFTVTGLAAAVAAGLVIWALPATVRFLPEAPSGFWAMVLLGTLVDIPIYAFAVRAGQPARTTLSACFTFAIFLLYGAEPAIVVQAVAATVAALAQRYSVLGGAFLTARLVCALAAGELAVLLTEGRPLARPGRFLTTDDVIGFVLPAVVWFVVSFGLLLGARVATYGGGLRRAVLDVQEHVLATTAALLLVSPLLTTLSGWWITLVAVPLFALGQLTRLSAQRERRLRRDPVTGLLNRRGLIFGFESLTAEDRLDPTRQRPLAVAVITMESLLEVNRTLGRDIYERLVAAAARRLAREYGEDLVGRLSGEGFVLILPGLTSEAAVAAARPGARIVLIGTLAAQLSAASSGTTAPVELDTFQLIVKDITVRGLLSVDERTGAEWVERFGGWLRSGEITFPHTRIAGIDRAPEALQGLLSGRYVGTVVVEL